MGRLTALALLACAAATPASALSVGDTPNVITVQWSNVTRMLKTQVAFQTVVNPLTTRESPIHDAVYDSIAALGVQYQRFVPWLPYPRLGIAALEGPSVDKLCGFVNSGGPGNIWNTTLDCGGRGLGVIQSVTFASYGQPTGFCGSLARSPSCDVPGAASVVAGACVGKPSCTVQSNDEFFGAAAPCGAQARLAVEVTCSAAKPGQVYTYWDFSLLDEGMLDFLTAADSSARSTIPNFSTIPSWLFNSSDRVYFPDDPLGETWDYEGHGNDFRDPSLVELGDYYGRLLAHYTEGGFTDEAGNWVPGYKLNISHWEVLNEIEAEHSMSPATYTAVYDAIVAGIRRWAPTGSAGMKFIGLALEGSDHVNYVSYFLNASNHPDPSTPIDGISFHHYAGSSARDGGDAQGSSYSAGFFPSADAWLADVASIMAVRDALNPGVLLDADEVGVILPDDNDAKWTSDAPGFPLLYWNAAAASYAYLYGSSSALGLDVLGESQLVGYPSLPFSRPAPVGQWVAPPQYPSVAMLNWTDGSGTARYWVLKLLADNIRPGGPAGSYPSSQADVLVSTTVGSGAPSSGPFCGSVLNLDTLGLYCAQPGAVISSIQFASYGTPTGSCGSWAVGACNAANSTAIVGSYCLGRSSCSVPATTPVFGDPCYDTVKTLAVQATCSSGGGGQSGTAPVYAQAYVERAGSGDRKLLVVNKVGTPQNVTVPGLGAVAGASWTFVDPSTAFGPPSSVPTPAGVDSWTVAPFAVGILRMPVAVAA